MREISTLRRSAFAAVFLLLCGLLAVSLCWAVTFGSADLTVRQVYGVLVHRLFGSSYAGNPMVGDIVWYVRLPRLILALGAGMALSLSGAVMQALARNPLADPYILGMSSGAALGATLGLLFGLGSGFFGAGAVGALAFIGAFSTACLVMALAHLGGRPGPVKLLLAGAALSSLCSAVSNLLIYLTGTADAARRVMFWTMGSLAGANWGSNWVLLLLASVSAVFFTLNARKLDLLALGDETALSLGVNPAAVRPVYLLISSLLVALSVYTGGLIGFVGLVVPHGVRLVFGSAHRRLIPLTAVCGALFLLWADVLSRVALKGAELPIGLITALVGAPWFIVLMARSRGGFGGDS